MPDVLGELVRDVHACATLESLATGKGFPKPPKPRARRRVSALRTTQSKAVPFDTHERVTEVVQACREERKRRLATAQEEDLSDERLGKLARFTDAAALQPFAPFLHFVPRLVNIVCYYTGTHSLPISPHFVPSPVNIGTQVTLAEAVPMEGSGLVPGQPLDLNRIAARCNGAYFAPKRFAAVQLAYTNPRCRILVFHTGRVVGTGMREPPYYRAVRIRPLTSHQPPTQVARARWRRGWPSRARSASSPTRPESTCTFASLQ